MPVGASSRAASIRARLNERRRRLPAKATTRVGWSATTGVDTAVDPEQHQRLATPDASLDVLGDRQRLALRQRAQQIALEPHADQLAGPAGRIGGGGHLPTLAGHR